MSKYLVSVIVPVYNNKHFVKRCVKSITRQSYEKVEIIIVDDGSNDGTEKILDKISEKNKKVTVVHKKNFGVSSARNLGIEMAHGDYIMFVDADDVIKRNCIKYALDVAIREDADIVKFSYTKKLGVLKKKYKYSTVTNKIIPRKEFDEKIFSSVFMNYDFTNVWTMLLKANLARKNKFRAYKRGEDFFYSIETLMDANNIYIMSKPLYQYTIQRKSVTHMSDDAGAKEEIEVLCKISDIVKNKNGLSERIKLIKK